MALERESWSTGCVFRLPSRLFLLVVRLVISLLVLLARDGNSVVRVVTSHIPG